MDATLPKIYIGIDVAKDKLDIASNGHLKHFVVDNTSSGITKLIKRAQQASRDEYTPHLVMEASGGYERKLMERLHRKGIAFSLLNPRKVRDFARGMGHLAKTDKIDAQVLATCGEKMEPRAYQHPGKARMELIELETRRSQLLDERVREKNRVKRATGEIKADIEAHLKYLTRRIEKLEEKIQSLIEVEVELKTISELLQTIHGVGKQTACAILARFPELGQLDHKPLSALVGVAPFNCDSGNLRGKRRTYGGRHKIRTSLYMAVLSASKHNPVIKDFYERLMGQGKPAKVALTACMHKLVHIMNAMVRDMEPFRVQES